MVLLYATSVSAQTDHTSKVPRFTFGNTLKEQERQLKNNPLLVRFKQSRNEQSVNKHRPLYHFISPEGRLNDPNGLSYWQGKWHLFYQAYPPEDPRQHWGHAVSNDLVHWKDLPYAIYPNPEEKVYSGTTWVENDRVIAMYHGVGAGSMVATSTDPLLLNWEKVTGKSVIPIPKPGEKLPYNVFDPSIWKKGDYYYALLAGTRPVGPDGKNLRANFLFRSENLEKWEYLHPFVEQDLYGLVGDDGACPYFWPIGPDGRYILLHFSHMSGGKYLLGDYDTERDKFIVTDGGNFNHGPVSLGGVHAPSATPDGNGGVICLFNMNSGQIIKPGQYTELMTLPRLLTIGENGKLAMQPAGDIESLRGEHASAVAVVLPANEEIVLDNIQGDAIEMNFEIDLKEATNIEIGVLRSPGKEEYTRILFYKDGGYLNNDYAVYGNGINSAIAIDNSMSSVARDVTPRVTETADVWMKGDELVNIRVFVDRSVVEVFVNNRQCIAVRAYPERDDAKGVSIRAQGSDALLNRIDAWQMKSIYNTD